MIRDNLPNLDQFFGAYFHEDWNLDDPNPEAVIERYLREAKPAVVRKTLDELSQLVAMNLSEQELSHIFINDLYCNYDPSFEGKSHLEWLQWVQITLKKELKVVSASSA